ncbi:MAG: universal stress protein [Myxococcaceae bacterium]|nr:universal stress protein [Myxococcaceae bacterium]
MRLLVAVDGSVPSHGGVRWAAEAARAMGAQVELVYVTMPAILPLASYGEALKEIEKAEAARAEEVFAAAEHTAGMPCLHTNAKGTVAEAISDLANAKDVWAVVIGAKGHNAFSRMMLGSTADRLAHVCTKPVVIVR